MSRPGAFLVAAGNAVRRGPAFRRRAVMLASRSPAHGSSHADAHLAHAESRFAAARRPIRPR